MRYHFVKIFSVVCFGFALLTGLTDPAMAQFEGKDKEAIEEIVRQYILKNPEIIVEAMENLQDREKVAKESSQRHTLQVSRAQIYDNPLSPEHGNPKGDAVVVEFFDYQCGYCKRVFPTFMNVLESDKNIRVIWKELPILGPVSRFASRAAMASDRQGKYFEYHVALMNLRGRLTEKKVLETATAVGLDMTRLVKDMAAPEINRYLDETLQLAEALGINGTPAFLIGDQLVPGAIDEAQMRAIIASTRKPKS
jgi:protein-disulfide isomerase